MTEDELQALLERTTPERERYGLFVMYWRRSGVDTFVVHDDATTFRYRPGSGQAGTNRESNLVNAGSLVESRP